MRLILILSVLALLAAPATEAAELDRSFLENNCLDCHSGGEPEAGLDLTKLGTDLTDSVTATRWTRIHDRVAAGEMPPADYGEVPAKERTEFVTKIAQWIRNTQQADFAQHGRVRARRLTNLQLERSLHDLLGVDVPLAVHFPAEPQTGGYTTVADGQPMSHFQMEQHLAGVDRAMEEAYRRALSKEPDEFTTRLSAKALSRTNPRRRCREPEILDGHGVVWSSGLMFYGRIPATTAQESGWYRFTVRAKALNSPKEHGVWCTVRRGRCVSSAPLLAWVHSFEATNDTQEWTFETWLPKGELLEIRPGDRTLRQARFAGGQVGAGEGGPQNVPGVAIESIVASRIHRGPTNEQIKELLFGSLEIKRDRNWRRSEVVSKSPQHDAAELITQFATRAFRRPVDRNEVQQYIDFVQSALEQGESFATALQGGYRAILCSPRFLYFQEMPGQLDSYAVASRLSYFLWNQNPDAELLRLAAADKLRDPKMIRKQAERMLADPRGAAFITDFAEQWLDLSQIDFTEPDRRLYRTFDMVVQQAMLDETQAYLQNMLQNDLSVVHVIDSDFTFLNSRLARYYELPQVEGKGIQRVTLPADSPRGGLLGQGAILKVTANGTTTSPVIRGVWISERLLGQEIPEPPIGVAAIEPDIRGAKTIRDQLEKHKSVETCASCHRHIDPPGFALENFDPAGNWRTRYNASSGKKREPIDASYEFDDGRKFDDIAGFRQHVLHDPESLAHNVVHHLLTYGTGAPIHFADRETVDQIVKQAAPTNYGLRTLLVEAVASRLFLEK